MEVVGKKGSIPAFLGLDVAQRITDVEDRIAFARVAEMGRAVHAVYEKNEVAAWTCVHAVSLVGVHGRKPCNCCDRAAAGEREPGRAPAQYDFFAPGRSC